jgi:PAS domain S-box-containing protein
MVEHMPIGVATLDSEGAVLYANPELARLLGGPREQMIGKPVVGFVHPDEEDVVARWIGSGDGGGPGTLRVGRPASWTQVHIECRPVDRGATGIFTLIAGDITDRVVAEGRAALRAELLDAVDAAVVAIDLDGVISEWSAGATRLYGLERDETIGRLVTDLEAASPDPKQSEEIMRSVYTEGSWSGRIEIRRPDGGVISVYTRALQTHDHAGAPSGMVSIGVDDTDQALAEQGVVRARDFLEAITDQMIEGIFVVDGDNTLSYMNPAAERLLGYGKEELDGRNMHSVLHYRRADGSPFPEDECPITKIRSGEKSSHSEDEDIFVRRDGADLPVAYTATAFETPEGARGVSVVFRDISREKAERDESRRQLERMSWVGPIRRALAEDGLMLYGQPIVDLSTREQVQQELLVRLVDDGEVVAAGRFMPAAEEYGIVLDIDRWVIQRAISIAAACGQPVEFNLSADAIQDPSTPDAIEEQIEATGVNPAHVVVEVTESGFIQNYAIAERFAARVVGRGCKLALDDFGTGFGAFTYLTHLPISILKIDRSFVAALPDDEASLKVVQAVVGLAEAFGQTTVAEGVEDEATLDLLGELGVDQAQGYFLGRPAPLEEC